MPATEQDFTHYANTSLKLKFTVTGINPTTADSASWTVTNRSGTVLVTKTVGSGITLTSTSATVQIEDADLTTGGIFEHCLKIVSGGLTSVLAVGNVTVKLC